MGAPHVRPRGRIDGEGRGIRATDDAFPATLLDKQFTISITDANDAPTFAGYSISTADQKTASISYSKPL